MQHFLPSGCASRSAAAGRPLQITGCVVSCVRTQRERGRQNVGQKTFPWWAVILAIALVVLTCIGLFISRPKRIMNRYEACMDAVSASTIYAKRHRGVRALVDGQELRLRESNARSIYSSLAALGVGHFTGSRMPPSITVTPR